MKSVRLTHAMRDQITNNILEQWETENPKPDVQKFENKFAKELWLRTFHREKPVLDKVPREFLKLSKHIKYCVNGQVSQVKAKDELPVNWSSYSAPVLATVADTDKHYSAYKEAVDAKEVWDAERKSIKKEADAVIYSVNTTGQLIELWPECEPFLPAHIADPSKAIKLPALQLSKLNERIGINKSEEKK